jgi:hypothetical protein
MIWGLAFAKQGSATARNQQGELNYHDERRVKWSRSEDIHHKARIGSDEF